MNEGLKLMYKEDELFFFGYKMAKKSRIVDSLLVHKSCKCMITVYYRLYFA